MLAAEESCDELFDQTQARWAHLGKAPGAPYTLMRLASLVPDEIPVEIWDENLRDLPLDTLKEGDLVGVTAMTVDIDRSEPSRRAMKQGAGVVVGGVHATLLPEHVQTFAHSTMVGEGYFTCAVDPGLCRRGRQGLKSVYRMRNGPTSTASPSPTADSNGGRAQQLLDAHGDHAHARNCSFCTAIRASGAACACAPSTK